MSETPAPTSAVLMSLSKHIASKCAGVNKAFVACKSKNADPAACLKEGDAVTGCVIALLKDVSQKCPDKLESYYKCMDYYSNDFTKCRKEQAAFEEACPPS